MFLWLRTITGTSSNRGGSLETVIAERVRSAGSKHASGRAGPDAADIGGHRPVGRPPESPRREVGRGDGKSRCPSAGKVVSQAGPDQSDTIGGRSNQTHSENEGATSTGFARDEDAISGMVSPGGRGGSVSFDTHDNTGERGARWGYW